MSNPGSDEDSPPPMFAPSNLADEAERARTPRTPFVAMTGVWLTVFAAVVLIVAVALTLYLVLGGR